jgi:hypothetical protein
MELFPKTRSGGRPSFSWWSNPVDAAASRRAGEVGTRYPLVREQELDRRASAPRKGGNPDLVAERRFGGKGDRPCLELLDLRDARNV